MRKEEAMPHPTNTRSLYESTRWRQRVRKQVLHNAGHQCARCGTDLSNAGKYAHVHHVIPTEHAPQLAFSPLNLEALCVRCHNKAHGRGGAHGCDVNGNPLDPDHPWNSSQD
jgi:5-methylcytosine-specific restriction enzyme A